MKRTMSEVTDPNISDICDTFRGLTRPDPVGAEIADGDAATTDEGDELFADLPTKWPEPSEQDRAHMARRYQRGNHLRTGF